MKLPDERLIFAYWLVVVLFIASAACFFLSGRSSAKVKKKLFYWYIAIGGTLIMGWFCMLGGPMSLVVFIPVYAIVSYISLRTTRFCDACGKVLMNQFVPARYCSRCGADLNAQDEAPNDRSK
jgi:hypothetical protein